MRVNHASIETDRKGGRGIRKPEAHPPSKVPLGQSTSAPIHAAPDPQGESQLHDKPCPCAGGCPRCLSRCLAPEGGQQLTGEPRRRMEATLGHDFSNVRLHMDAAAQDVTRRFDAQALTRGSHIWLDPTPLGTPEGERVLAHELTHVMQYETGELEGLADGAVVPASDRVERQAMTLEKSVTHHQGNGVASPSVPAPATSRRTAPILLRRNKRKDETEAFDELPEEAPAGLLNELQRDELWTPQEEPGLRQALSMARDQMDEAIEAVIADRWVTHGGLLASMGFGPNGELTKPDKKTPRWLRLFGRGLSLLKKPDEIKEEVTGNRGVVELGMRVLLRRWNKEEGAIVEPLTIAEVQKLLGNSIYGVNLDGLENELLEGIVELELSPRIGYVEIELKDVLIPSLTWAGDSEIEDKNENGTLNITAYGVKFDNFKFRAEWPSNRKELGTEVLHMPQGKIETERIVVSNGGVESAEITGLILDNLDFSVEIGQFKKGRRVPTLAMVRHIEEQLSRLTSIIPASVGALVSTLNPQSQSTPFDFISKLTEVLQSKLDGSLLLQSNQTARLHADSVTLDNMALGTVEAGFELLVYAGARPLAIVEAQENLGHEDDQRRSELRRISEMTDREEADKLLEEMGLDPNNLVMRVTTSGLTIKKAGETDERQGLNIPSLPIGVDALESDDPIVLTVRFPGSIGEQENPNEVLYTVTLATDGELELPGAQETRVAGLKLESGPLTLSGVTVNATVLHNEQINIEGKIDSAKFQTIDWGRYTIDAVDGIATDIKIEGMVERGSSGFEISQTTPLKISAGVTEGSQINITISDLLQAKLMGPRLLGMSIVLSEGALPKLHVTSGSVTGFEGLLAGIFGGTSDSFLGFEDFETEAIIDIGNLPFSFGKLISGDIDWTLYGENLIAKRLDGVPIETDALGANDVVGHIEVLENGLTRVVVEADSAPFGKVDWGGYKLDAKKGDAKGVELRMDLKKGEVAGVDKLKGIDIQIKVDQLNAASLDIALPDVLRATLQNPVLHDLSANTVEGEGLQLHVDSGVVSGFDGVLHEIINTSSTSPLSFTGFDSSALIDLGRFSFSFEQLISGTVDVNSFGRDLVVERFGGSLSGELSEQKSGSLLIQPSIPLVFGPMLLHLGPRSEHLGPVDLGWGSLTLSDSANLTLEWQALSDALSVTLTGLHADTATATGLYLKTRLAGADVVITMSANGEASLNNLNADELKLVIAEEYLSVDGLITGKDLEAKGLFAQLGERLSMELLVKSKSLTFYAFSDGDDQYSLEKLVLTAYREIEDSRQEGGSLHAWTVSLEGDLSGAIGEQGITGQLTGIQGNEAGKPSLAQLELDTSRGGTGIGTEKFEFTLQEEQMPFELGSGSLERKGISLKFEELIAIGKLGQPGDTPTSLGDLKLHDGSYSGNLPIIKLSEIKLTDGSIEIDDLSQWISESDLAQLDDAQLREFADAVSGSAEFTIVLEDNLPDFLGEHTLDLMPNPWADVEINPVPHDTANKVKGNYTWALLPDWPTLFSLDGRLLTSTGRNGAIDTLYDFESLPLSGRAKWPPKKPIELDLEGNWTATEWMTKGWEINGYTDIEFDLELDASTIPLPKNNVLRVESAGDKKIRLIGEQSKNISNRLNITVTGLDSVSVRALLFNMFDFEASGIHVDQATNLEVDYAGLAVKRVYGEIVSAEIKHLDIAEIPAFNPDTRPLSSIPTLYFESNSLELSRDPALESEKSLANAVALIKEEETRVNGSWQIIINGYAGNEAQADMLSEARAARVAQILMAQGIDGSKITIKGNGLDSSGTGEFNQRVEIQLTR